MSFFFIHRPIFAWVIALFIILAGIISIQIMPVALYPNVAPPSINITVSYPGASAKTLDETVVSIIEGEINGAEGLIYMSSVSQVNGVAEIMVTFDTDIDPDMAQVDIQNRLARATPRLPQAVTQQGIQVAKSNSNILLIITLASPNGRFNSFELGDYASRNIVPTLQRIKGVGQTRVFGSERALRVWLDMPKLVSYGLTPEDIIAAIRSQNAQVSAGIIGDLPSIEFQDISATLVISGQLTSIDEFNNIVLKVHNNGAMLKLKDVARVELGGQNYSVSARKNGGPVIGIAIQPSPSGNAVETVANVREQFAELEKYFPADMEYDIPVDASEFIKISIQEVVETLIEAMILVFIVMFVFLQNIRYTLIPTIVVPIALMGTFTILSVLGFSINVLSMFAMVLAIGILVDDAIVVVENVERIMTEEGLSAVDATVKAMQQITGAIVGITVVLVSVFIPMAFFHGSVGNIYKQFSVTMTVSILLSAFLALSLTPALCATLLKPNASHGGVKKGFFGAFNRLFDSASSAYQSMVGAMLRRTIRFMFLYAAIIGVALFLFLRLPTSFLPDEDQGRIFTVTQLPPGATAERSIEVAKKIEDFYAKQPEVQTVVSIIGTNFFGAGQNMVNMFVSLKHWDERTEEENSAASLAQRGFMALMPIKEAFSVAINLPPIPELGNATGFSLRLQDRAAVGSEVLKSARDEFLKLAAKNKALANVRVEGVEDAPQLQLIIDREKAFTMGVNFTDINRLFSSALGSSYINDFPNKGRMQRVIVQADAPYRMQGEDLLKMHVRNAEGKMVPVSSFASIKWISGPMQVIRFNGYPAYRISGVAAPGYSTGQAMKEIENIVTQLPQGIGYEWSGISREERISGSQSTLLLALSCLAVFLCLAALYESWSVPFAVILSVPLGILGSLLAATVMDMSNDVYFKVGLIAIMGLSAKNAILIIEFAKELQHNGMDVLEAVKLACKLRFRPILMTSFAFILGVLPLAMASGAGSAAQRAIGTGVMGGMISATVLAIFLVPVFFIVIRKVFPAK